MMVNIYLLEYDLGDPFTLIHVAVETPFYQTLLWIHFRYITVYYHVLTMNARARSYSIVAYTTLAVGAYHLY